MPKATVAMLLAIADAADTLSTGAHIQACSLMIVLASEAGCRPEAKDRSLADAARLVAARIDPPDQQRGDAAGAPDWERLAAMLELGAATVRAWRWVEANAQSRSEVADELCEVASVISPWAPGLPGEDEEPGNDPVA
jgi:hypothetical protein